MGKGKKRLLKAIIALLAILVIADIGGSIFMVNVVALKPNKRVESEALSFFCEKHPDLKPWIDSLKAANDWHYADTTFNGNKLHALYITAAQPTNKVAVLIHGYKDCNISMLHVAEIYSRKLGYNVILPDLYAHGKSEGDHINMGWNDRLDVMQWMKYANNLFKGDSAQTQMVVHGISMGAATTMCISGEKQEPYVKCFVEDCGYTSVADEFRNELKRTYSFLPAFPMLQTASLICKLEYGWSFEEASPIEQVKKSTLPMLFIHGDDDDFVPYSMLQPLYEAKTTGPKEIYIGKGSKHAKTLNDHKAEYTAKVINFVRKYIK